MTSSSASVPAELTPEELEREAENQLSIRLRSQRLTLRQRQAAADAAHLDSVPLFTACIQWPNVIDRLQQVFLKRAKAHTGRCNIDAQFALREDEDEGARDSGEPEKNSSIAAVDDMQRPAPTFVLDNGVFSPSEPTGPARSSGPNDLPKKSKHGASSLVPKGTVGEKEFVDSLWSFSLGHLLAARGVVPSPIDDKPLTAPAADGGDADDGTATRASSEASSSPTSSFGAPPFSIPPRMSVALQCITPAFERQHKTQFRRVFRACDTKQSGGITWDALTSFMLDSSMFMKYQRETAFAQRSWFHIRESMPVGAHRPRQVKAMAGTNDVLVVDASGVMHRFDTDTQTAQAVDMQRGDSPPPQLLLLIDAEYIPTDCGICFSTVGAEMYYFDCTHRYLERILLQDSAQILSWHPAGKKLICGDREGRVSGWRMQKISPASRSKVPVQLWHFFVAKGVCIQAIACAAQRDVVAAGCDDGTVQLFTTGPAHPAMLRRFRTSTGTLNALSISEHQNVVAVGSVAFHPELWSIDGSSGSTPFVLEARVVPHTSPIVSVLCVQGAPQCFSLDYGGIVKLWHMQLFCCLQSFQLRKQDPRCPWKGLVEHNDYVFCTDRISVTGFHVVEDGDPVVDTLEATRKANGRLIEHQVTQRGAAVAAVYFDRVDALPPLMVTASGCNLMYWDLSAQRMTAQFTPTPTPERITSMCRDERGARMFCGTDKGSVWVVSVQTTGLLECFPHVCEHTSVAAVAFLSHAGVGICCGENGAGVLLQPSSRVVSSAMHQAGQPAFTGMNAGICVAIGSPWFLVVTADRDHKVHFFSSSEVQSVWKLVHLASCWIPDATAASSSRASSFRRKFSVAVNEHDFMPKGRRILEVRHIAHSQQVLLFVADNVSISVVSLHSAHGAETPRPPFRTMDSLGATVLAQWNMFSAFDGNIASFLEFSLSAQQVNLVLQRLKAATGEPVVSVSEEQQADRALQEQLVLGDDDSPAVQTADRRSTTPPNEEEPGVDASDDAQNDARSQFQREMDALYEHQRAQEQLILDPQIILTEKAIQQVEELPNQSAMAEDTTAAAAIAARYLVVAFESGSVVLLDAMEAISGCLDDDVVDATLLPLRMCRLRTSITTTASLGCHSFCVGRSDGLVDVVEVPSLGLQWSGLPAVADMLEYFPPTADLSTIVKDGEERVLKSLVSVSKQTISRHRSSTATSFRQFAASSFRSGTHSSPTRGAMSPRWRQGLAGSPRKASTIGFDVTPPPNELDGSGSMFTSDVPSFTKPLAEDTEDTCSLSSGLDDWHHRARVNLHPIGLDQRCTTSSSAPRDDAKVDKSKWTLGQLSTLCGDRSILDRQETAVAARGKADPKLLRCTPSGILVYEGNDPFAECSSADPTLVREGRGNATADNISDNRQSKTEKRKEELTLKHVIVIKKFDDLGVSRPSSSRSFVTSPPPEALPRHVPPPMLRGSLLRPMSGGGWPHAVEGPGSSHSGGMGSEPRPRSQQSVRTASATLSRPHTPVCSTQVLTTAAPVLSTPLRGSRESSATRTIGPVRSVSSAFKSVHVLKRSAVELPPWLPK